MRVFTSFLLALLMLPLQSAFGQTYSISGDINGSVGYAFATMRLRQADSHTVVTTEITDSSGNFTFSGLADGDYTIAPSIFGYEYAPGVTAVTVSGSDVNGVDFVVQLNQPENRIYGTVTGPGATGATITLGTDPEVTLLTDGQGYYLFPDVPNGTYTVTPSKTGFTFALASSGTPTFNATVDDYDRLAPNFVSSEGGLSDQSITDFTATPSSGTLGGSSILSATASSGLSVIFDSTTPAICTISGSTVTYVAVGTCTVTADQPGNESYNPAPQETLGITVAKADQTISGFGVDPATGSVGGSSTLSATASSALSILFGSSTPGVCTVSGNIVSYLAVGTCTVTADQTGDDSYNPAPQETLDITVTKADQTISGFGADPATGSVGGSSTLSATASSALSILFGSSTPGVCTVSGNMVSYLAVGTCTVTADQAGDDSYNPAPQETLDITVAKADQTISGFGADPATGSVGGSSTLSATASSALNILFGSSTPGVCTVSGNIVSYLAVGTCTVTADQAGDDSYNPAQQMTLDIGVDLLDQAITNFAANPSSGVIDGSSILSASGGASGNPVVFGSNTQDVCTVSGNIVSYLAVGTCTVTANQAGDDSYNPAQQVILDIEVSAQAEQLNAIPMLSPASLLFLVLSTFVIGGSVIRQKK